jgi:hypothetical protein
MSTPVRKDQFEISLKGITHTPTGAKYTPHPGAPHSGTLTLSELGSVSAIGEDYRPHEVRTMMERLWAEYVDANPRLFEVHDLKADCRCPRRIPALHGLGVGHVGDAGTVSAGD